ncbi:MAG: sugar transferase [Actinomycetota bacterium]
MRVEKDAEELKTGSLDQAEAAGGNVLTIVEGDIAVVHEGFAQVERVELPGQWVELGGVGRGQAARWSRLMQLVLLATDTLCLALALVVVHLHPANAASGWSGWVAPILAVVWVGVLAAFGLYEVDIAHRLRASDEVRRIVGATGVAATLVLVFGTTVAARRWMPLALVALAVSELGARAAWRSVEHRLHLSGRLAARALAVGNLGRPDGSGPVVEPGSGLTVIGRVEVDGEPSGDDVPTFGRLSDLPEIVRDREPDCLLVNATGLSPTDLDDIRRVARVEGVDLHIGVMVPETLPSGLDVCSMGSFTSVRVHTAKLIGTRAAVKRALDIAIASLTLIVASPLIGAIAVAVAVTSPGPVLFKQERVTKGLRTFTIYKFRTMIRDVDALIDERSLDKSTPFFKPREDDMVTGVGRFLRRTSLDELPQAWNVLRGDMSLVGPRPLPVEQVEANPELLEPRHDVRAGVTGWWQVGGRSDVDPAEAVRKDMFYIENWSLALDLSILVKTAVVLLHRRGAY